MKKKAKRIAKMMGNDSLGVVAQMIVDEAMDIRYEVYADGSFKDGHCGCGWLVIHKGAIVKIGRMSNFSIFNNSIDSELRAIVYALGDCPSFCSVDLYVDCQAAIAKLQTGKLGGLASIYNKVIKGKVVRFHWVKAHENNIYNDMADSLAFAALEC